MFKARLKLTARWRANALPEYMLPGVILSAAFLAATPALNQGLSQIFSSSINSSGIVGNTLTAKPFASDVKLPPPVLVAIVPIVPAVVLPPPVTENAPPAPVPTPVSAVPSFSSISKLVETTGSSGATLTLLSTFVSQVQQLLSQGKITPAQAGQLNDLANQGYHIANIEKSLEQYVQANGWSGSQSGQTALLTIDGQTQSLADWAQTIRGSVHPYYAPYGFDTTNMLQGIASDVYGSSYADIYKFATLYTNAKNSGVLSTPELESLVTGLSTQIAYLSSNMGGALYNNSFSNDATLFNQNLASHITSNNSTGICVAGQGNTTGQTCY